MMTWSRKRLDFSFLNTYIFSFFKKLKQLYAFFLFSAATFHNVERLHNGHLLQRPLLERSPLWRDGL